MAAANCVRQHQAREPQTGNTGANSMPKENDLEGVQDQGGKHGGQKGMPKPEPKPPHGPDEDTPAGEKRQRRRDETTRPG
jgi:hypothetical protein